MQAAQNAGLPFPNLAQRVHNGTFAFPNNTIQLAVVLRFSSSYPANMATVVQIARNDAINALRQHFAIEGVNIVGYQFDISIIPVCQSFIRPLQHWRRTFKQLYRTAHTFHYIATREASGLCDPDNLIPFILGNSPHYAPRAPYAGDFMTALPNQGQISVHAADQVLADAIAEVQVQNQQNAAMNAGVHILQIGAQQGPAFFFQLAANAGNAAAGNANADDLFSSGDRIQAYIEQIAHLNHLEGNVRLDTTVTDAIWSDDQNTWTIGTHSEVQGRREYTCKILISAVGNLTIPAKLSIDGIERFRGNIMHTSQYDRGVDLQGKDVVVIGNGCTGTQLVPAIATEVKSLSIFGPSKHWYLPRPTLPMPWLFDFLSRYSAAGRSLLRFSIFAVCEDGFRAMPWKSGARYRHQQEKASKRYIEKTAPVHLRDSIIPDFAFGTKRLIFDNGFLSSLHLAHVDYKPERISAIVEEGVLDQDGKLIPADVIIAATGYQAQQYLLPLSVKGQHGKDLHEHMKREKRGLSSYKGTFYSGFPNFASVYGPNTGTGHSSAIFSQECQIDMIIKRMVMPVLRDEDVENVAVRPEAERKWMEWLRKEMADTVWEQERQGWYTDDAGLCTTLYPKSQLHFWWSTWSTPASDFIHSPRDSKVLYGSVEEMEYVLYIFLYLAFFLCVACL